MNSNFGIANKTAMLSGAVLMVVLLINGLIFQRLESNLVALVFGQYATNVEQAIDDQGQKQKKTLQKSIVINTRILGDASASLLANFDMSSLRRLMEEFIEAFAVVANEIKELARQTAAATQDIKKKIDGIQNSTSTTIDKIGKITQVIANVKDLVATIATAVEEQSVTTREIAENISQAAVGINEVNRKVTENSTVAGVIARSISEVDHTAGEIADSSIQVKGSTGSLLKLAEQLNTMVGRFRI